MYDHGPWRLDPCIALTILGIISLICMTVESIMTRRKK